MVKCFGINFRYKLALLTNPPSTIFPIKEVLFSTFKKREHRIGVSVRASSKERATATESVTPN